VLYGQQLTCDLTYEEAAKELGAAIMHAQACRGALQP
jgi:hypothetical protein